MVKGTTERWIASGAAALTGDAEGPCLVPPPDLIRRIGHIGERLGRDAIGLLVERAALADLGRAGPISCGGASRLLPTERGWLALSLARPDDIELLPAWLGAPDGAAEPWLEVAARVATRAAAELVAAGRPLGLPLAEVGEVRTADDYGVRARQWGGVPPLTRTPLVVDLSSLWAGPLCARVLGELGADVVKVESVGRPDGARDGAGAFFDRLHAGHRSVALDFADATDRARLRALLGAADVVIEASRPRALRQLGIEADDLVQTGPRVWVSITGYGRDEAAGLATAFGDDAAAAGGLVAWGADGAPRFAVDAIADPLSGLVAAVAVRDALEQGMRTLLDVRMAGVAAAVVGPAGAEPWTPVDPQEVEWPSIPAPVGVAPARGADTDAVLGELGID